MILPPCSRVPTHVPFKRPFPKFNVVPTLTRFEGFTRVSQTFPSFSFSNKTSTLAPVSSFTPYNLAGMTRVSFKTRQSPGDTYSIKLLNLLCVISPLFYQQSLILKHPSPSTEFEQSVPLAIRSQIIRYSSCSPSFCPLFKPS